MRREFTVELEDEKKLELVFKQPSSVDIEEADMVYSQTIARLVRDSKTNKNKKLLLRSELEEFLQDNGIWTEKDEKRINELNKEIRLLMSKLKRGGIKLGEGRQIALQITDKRVEYINAMQKRRVFDDATIESLAENDKFEYFVFACTVDPETGNKYWESFEDMKNDKTSNVYSHAASIASEVLYGLGDDIDKGLPENQWLQKFGFIDEEMRFVDRKTGKYVDRSGRPLDEVSDETNTDGESRAMETEDQPFIDDETGEPVLVGQSSGDDSQEERKTKAKKKTVSKKKETGS